MSVHRGLPESALPPPPVNPFLQSTIDYGGNDIVERIARGTYAFYAHMVPGSVRVRARQRLRAGQLIGLVGNSGNSTSPHLHFSIQDGPAPVSSNSLPFVIDRFKLQGTLIEGRSNMVVKGPVASAAPAR